MARIRALKPEFSQSESMGRVSRDARLLFILLWPICDDSGRTRGDSRFLARTLYPYDDGRDGAIETSASNVDVWLDELEAEKCIVRYEVDGSTYLQIVNWLKHQKIDKPSASKLPAFADPSRDLANSPPRNGKGKGKGSGEEKEEEVEEEGSDETSPPAPGATDGPEDMFHAEPQDPRQVVFDHWRKVMGHSKAQLDDKRKKLITAALKLGYTGVDLCHAIDGCKSSKWYMGANDRNTVFDGLDLILRDAEHVDKFLALYAARETPQLGTAGSAAAQAAQRWLKSTDNSGESSAAA